ncbi:hypothetical protein GGR51DRAFT_503999 [Nemania sp. FL0031]|nr:hypothetical protein GGR51DRAFT_503999 [Nemania sp. FL0031]
MLGSQALLMIFGLRFVLGGLIGPKAVAAPSGQFGLYAYGGSISGAQVFYSNDMAFIGDQTQTDDQEAATVLFSAGPNDGLVANPDMKSSRGIPTWSNKRFFVPSSTSASRRVGFTSKASEPDTDTDADTAGFVFYGATALHQNADNSLHSLFYAVPTPVKKIWALQWNVTKGDGNGGEVAVSLRFVAPAQPFNFI